MKPRKIKVFKIILISTTALIAVIASSTAALIYFFPEEKVRDLVQEKVRESMGLNVSFSKLSYSLRGITLQNISLMRSSEGEEKPLLTASEASLGYSLKSLLDKELKINYVFIKDMFLTLTIDSSGKTNLDSITGNIPQKKGDGSGIKASIDSIKFANATVSFESCTGVFEPLNGGYNFDADVEPLGDGVFSFKSSRLTLSGGRGTLQPEIKFTIDDKGFLIEGDSALDRCSLLWVYRWTGKPNPQPYNTVTGNVDSLKIHYAFDSRELNIEGHAKAVSTLTKSKSLVYGDGYAKVFRRMNDSYMTLFLSDVKGKINNSSLSLNRLLYKVRSGQISFSATDIDTTLPDLRNIVEVIPPELNGSVTGRMNYDNQMFSGSVSLKNISYGDVVSGVTTGIDINENMFKNENITAKVLGYPCKVSIASTDRAFKRVFADFKLDRLDIRTADDTSKNTGIAVPKKPVNFTFPIRIAGNIVAGKLKVGNLEASNAALSYSAEGKVIAIDRFSLNIFGGTFKGTGSIVSKQAAPELFTHFSFSNAKMQDIASFDESIKNRFFGIAAGEGSLSGELNSDILKTLSGNVEISIDNGKIVNTGIQNGLGIWLTELRYKLQDLEFNKIYGNINFEKTELNIKSFIFNSDDIRLKINGPIDLDFITKQLYISLEFNRRFIQDIPSPAVKLGLDRYYKNGWYIIPFTARGSITDGRNIKRVY